MTSRRSCAASGAAASPVPISDTAAIATARLAERKRMRSAVMALDRSRDAVHPVIRAGEDHYHDRGHAAISNPAGLGPAAEVPVPRRSIGDAGHAIYWNSESIGLSLIFMSPSGDRLKV